MSKTNESMALIPTWEQPVFRVTSFEVNAELIERFCNSQDVRENSRRSYRAAVEKFCGWMKSNGLAQPIREDIIRYRDELRGSGLAVHSVNLYLTAVRLFFAFLQTSKLYPNVAADVKGLKAPRGKLRDALPKEDIVKILRSMDRTTVRGKRDFAIVNLMVGLGLRCIEAVRLCIGDLRREMGFDVIAVWGKGRDCADEILDVIPEVLKPIMDYLNARGGRVGPGDPLFASLSRRNKDQRLTTATIWQICDRAFKQTELKRPRISAHSLRHSFVSITHKEGASDYEIMQVTRHADPSTLYNYIHDIDRRGKGAEKHMSFLGAV